MSRLVGLGNLLQAAALAGLAAWLAPRWTPAMALAVVAALLQLGAAGASLAGRHRVARWLSGLTVATAAALVGLFLQAALHVATAYGPEARLHGLGALAAVGAALPWLAGFPAWQWLRGRSPGPDAGRGLAGLLAALAVAGLAPAARAMSAGGDTLLAPQPAAATAAAAAYARWTTGSGALPAGPGPVDLRLSAWSKGREQKTVSARGPDLAAALQTALAALPAPGPRPALVLDLVVAQAPGPEPRPPGDWVGPTGSSATGARGGKALRRAQVIPGWTVPAVAGPGPYDHVQAWVTDSSGTAPLARGWAQAPPLSAETALAAARSAGDFLLVHQDAEGRFAYTVHGPDGREGSGYNFPRHAGVTWFLARLAARTGDPRYGAAADRGLDYLAAHSQQGPGGMAWVKDPRRKDGRAWAGTTALAALAAGPRAHPMAGSWGAFLAASVDDRGAVRGEILEADGRFPEQALNPYGQGQVSLALAALARDGHAELRPAALRAGAFLDGGYAPGGAERLVVLDEHWTCLAALTLQDLDGRPHGAGVCRAYLADSARDTPVSGSALALAAGPAGGMAEAVVAGAMLDPSGPHREAALAFGQHFLDSQYRVQDSPLLPDPTALIGGFRDAPWDLDVRMDAVQHIGCALLGVESLLRGQVEAGGRP